MANKAKVQTVVPGNVSYIQETELPDFVTAYDFSTDPDRPTVSCNGSTYTFFKWQSKVIIFDADTQNEVANSGDPYTGIPCTTAVAFSDSIRAAYHRWFNDGAYTDAQLAAALADSTFTTFLHSIVVGDIGHVKYQANLVNTALDCWDTTIRDRIMQMCDDFLGI